MTIIVPFGGMLADHLRKNGIMSTTNVRKLFNCGGFGLEGLFFLFVAHASTAVINKYFLILLFYTNFVFLRKEQLQLSPSALHLVGLPFLATM
jgi:hypothetical protein